MSFRQGTWQFMARDLVQQFNIWHTFAHDLESFFWVLLWIVLTRVPTYYTDAVHSGFIHGTMSPKVCSGSRGSTKMNFLVSSRMLEERVEDFHLPNNPSLHALLVEMKRTVANWYLSLPSKKESTPEPKSIKKIDAISIALKRDGVTESDKSRKALHVAPNNFETMNHSMTMMLGLLKDHHVVVELFSMALLAPWPTNDKAERKPILLPSSAIEASHSGSKRSQSTIEIQLAGGDQPSSKRQA